MEKGMGRVLVDGELVMERDPRKLKRQRPEEGAGLRSAQTAEPALKTENPGCIKVYR
jgi:hypothetical protein